MGATIRREPVNFDIPSSPNYKFLNITNFRGLNISNNPFELATNTASDCLNVYVDETNTLTTRPRLAKSAVNLIADVINVYNTSKGYLYQVKYNPAGKYFLLLLRGNLVTHISMDDEHYATSDKLCIFEHDTKIYVLTGRHYLYFDTNTSQPKLKPVEGYVPVTSIVDTTGKKHSVGSVNLLSDTYLEKREWFYDTIITDTDGEFENNTFKKSDYDEGPFKTGVHFEIGEKEYSSGVVYDGIFILDKNENELDFIPLSMYDTSIRPINPRDCTYSYNKNSKTLWGRDPINNMLFTIYETTNGWDIAIIHTPQCYTVSRDMSRQINEAGNKIILKTTTNYNEFLIFTVNRENNSYDVETKTAPHDVNSVFFVGNYPAYDAMTLFVYFDTTKEPVRIIDKDIVDYIGLTQKNIILCKNRSNVLYTYNIDEQSTNEQVINFSYKYLSVIDDYDASLWYCDYNGNIYIIPNMNDINNNHFHSGVTLNNFDFIEDSYVIKDYMFFRKNSHVVSKSSYEIYKRSDFTEPTVTVTKQSNNLPEWVYKREELFKSTLMTRFDNNYWFAVDNRYYRSSNNDPTYFPITEYNDLGDINDDITGFNIANDTTLIAYKEKTLYLIQPFTASQNTVEYSVTESKNTVGNTAIGAPIVTTLTEIPLQINYDGIYGLSQLKNVSAIERIADLMSEPINERWLNEDDKVIKNAQTLNRLYWTYVILPYDDKTKVYLLDNRTNSWYYWEFPIKVINSFVKDNATELVDANGDVYRLTSDDIENTNFDSVLVTEYYDYGKKLIPWYWQSQILYLGTMNYSKRLVNTTFILTDTDTQDGYGLQYSFKVFRKLASNVPEKELTGELNLVRSTTKKTNISKFGFIQLRMSNITEESQGTEAEKAFRNNKLRLVGLGLKYVLLEGLIR